MKNVPLEKTIIKNIVKYLESKGCYVWKNHGSMYSRAGVADITGVLPGGRMIAVEVKRQGNKTTQIQDNFINNCRNRGALAFVAYSVQDVESVMQGMDDQWKNQERRNPYA